MDTAVADRSVNREDSDNECCRATRKAVQVPLSFIFSDLENEKRRHAGGDGQDVRCGEASYSGPGDHDEVHEELIAGCAAT
jgi:hypothetical protein